MKSSVLVLLVISALTSSLRADLNSVEYTFDTETNTAGVWAAASNPWNMGYQYGGSLYVAANSATSNYIAYTSVGAGYQGVAFVENTAGTPLRNSVFSFEFSFYSEGYWGTSAGFGKLDQNELYTTDGIAIGASIRDGLTLQLGSSLSPTVSVNCAYSFASNSWYDVRLDVDLAGEGTASAYIRLNGSTTWNAIAAFTNVDLKLVTAAIDPTSWNTIWLREVGATSGVDNVSLVAESVPEPGTWSVLAVGSLLLMGRFWRKSKETPTA